MSAPRQVTQGAQLARCGFREPDRAQVLLDDPSLASLLDVTDDGPGTGLVRDLGDSPDPDAALLALVRLADAVHRSVDRAAGGSASSDLTDLLHTIRVGGAVRERLFTVLGSSTALSDHLARHPEHWVVLAEEDPPGPGELRSDLLTSVGADPGANTPVAAVTGTLAQDRLRVAYRRRLLSLAGRDLVAPDPLAVLPEVGSELADLAAAALETGLAIGRAELPSGAPECRLAVIGMGKCGGQELNYVSDVDVVFVVGGGRGRPPGEGPGTPGVDAPGGSDPPMDPEQERDLLSTAESLATSMMRACSASTAEGTLWPVDAGLRPEGKNGPLVRTLASHLAYYERWAKTWEFQALLKARPVAGDLDLGRDYIETLAPLVWRAAERENFVEDVQAMRRRVESSVSSKEADRQLKLGPGGLRDVEFSVQLLQLVHGRADESLRSPSTLAALAALAAGGYVGREDGRELDEAYRLIRALEHRLQLHRLARTHVMPEGEQDLRRLGRQLGYRADPVAGLRRQWRHHSREVRRLHERLFYRPLLGAVARLSTDEVRLSPDAARSRLHALGYRDPAGALRHLEALTDGVSRRAAIQRQLLPAMLGWFGDQADPDAGLLAFRRVSDALGSTHWYLKMLRDEGSSAQRLARVLACSRFAAQLLEQVPESVALLGVDVSLAPRSLEALRAEAGAAAERQEEPEGAVRAGQAIRRRELFRIATGDLVGDTDLATVGVGLSDLARMLVEQALAAAQRSVRAQRGSDLPTRLLVVAMGSLGAGELGYGSDADVMFVHDPLPGVDEQEAQVAALAVVTEVRRMLSRSGPGPTLDLDADLRPEGRQGPLVRSLASYAAYYARWSLVWESQALLRASPIAGDPDLGARFVELVDPIRYPVGGITEHDVREVRRVKARVESERLPRGAHRGRHLKLGPGARSDVEWCVQLLALQHGHQVAGLRTPRTLDGLRAAREASLLRRDDADVLAAAWTFASRIRNATVLWSGRGADEMPRGVRDLDGVARLLGYPAGSAARMDDEYRRVTRRARVAVERVLYE